MTTPSPTSPYRARCPRCVELLHQPRVPVRTPSSPAAAASTSLLYTCCVEYSISCRQSYVHFSRTTASDASYWARPVQRHDNSLRGEAGYFVRYNLYLFVIKKRDILTSTTSTSQVDAQGSCQRRLPRCSKQRDVQSVATNCSEKTRPAWLSSEKGTKSRSGPACTCRPELSTS